MTWANGQKLEILVDGENDTRTQVGQVVVMNELCFLPDLFLPDDAQNFELRVGGLSCTLVDEATPLLSEFADGTKIWIIEKLFFCYSDLHPDVTT